MVFGTFGDLPSPSVMLGPLSLGCCSVSAPSTVIALSSFSHPAPDSVPFCCPSEPLSWLLFSLFLLAWL